MRPIPGVSGPSLPKEPRDFAFLTQTRWAYPQNLALWVCYCVPKRRPKEPLMTPKNTTHTW